VSHVPSFPTLRRVFAPYAAISAAIAAALAVLAGAAWSAQDKYTLRVPDGLAFSEFRGYENWQVVAVSATEDTMKVMVANPKMIEAYRAGIPGNGKPFPDGSKMAKIEWSPKKSTEAPFSVNIPDQLKDVNFIARDSKRFKDSAGWGYALFKFDPAAQQFSPVGTGSNCGAECHKIAAAKDSIFTAYGQR
jgi:hypothetical protein